MFCVVGPSDNIAQVVSLHSNQNSESFSAYPDKTFLVPILNINIHMDFTGIDLHYQIIMFTAVRSISIHSYYGHRMREEYWLIVIQI